MSQPLTDKISLETKGKVLKHFEKYPKEKQCHATEDGNIFFGRDSKIASRYASRRKLVIVSFMRSAIPGLEKECAEQAKEPTPEQEAKPTKSNPSKK